MPKILKLRCLHTRKFNMKQTYTKTLFDACRIRVGSGILKNILNINALLLIEIFRRNNYERITYKKRVHTSRLINEDEKHEMLVNMYE